MAGLIFEGTNMAKYAKFFVALFGIAVLIGLQTYQVEIPGLSDIVRDLIVGALVAGGVYQVPNKSASAYDPMDQIQ